jgi:uncharacterized protein DUF4412
MRVRWPCPPFGRFALALALASPSTLPAQAFQGVLTMRVRDMPAGSEVRAFIRGGKMRMEIQAAAGAPMVMIADPAAGEEYVLLPGQQVYMAMKLTDLQKLADTVGRGSRSPTGSTMIASGKKAAVAGYSCEIYRYRDARSALDLCLAKGLGTLGAAAGLFGGISGRPGTPSDEPPWARELSRQGAFALRIADSTGATVWEVTRIERKALEAGLFAPPHGYRRMEVPSLGRRPPGGS